MRAVWIRAIQTLGPGRMGHVQPDLCPLWHGALVRRHPVAARRAAPPMSYQMHCPCGWAVEGAWDTDGPRTESVAMTRQLYRMHQAAMHHHAVILPTLPAQDADLLAYAVRRGWAVWIQVSGVEGVQVHLQADAQHAVWREHPDPDQWGVVLGQAVTAAQQETWWGEGREDR